MANFKEWVKPILRIQANVRIRRNFPTMRNIALFLACAPGGLGVCFRINA